MDNESLGELFARGEYYITRIVNKIIGEGKSTNRDTGYYIKLYDVSASVVRDFDYTEDGLSAALQESATGDTVWVPGGTITLTAAVSVPAGVTLKGDGIDRTTITATANIQNLITLGAASTLSDMTVNFTSSSVAESKAVFLQESSIRNLKVIKSETAGSSPNWGIEGDLYSSATEKLTSAENITVYVSETSGSGVNHRAINFDIENASPGVVIKNITGIVDITNANEDGYGIYLDGEVANEIYAYNIYGSCVAASTGSSVYGIQAGYSHIWNAQGIAQCDSIYANGILIWNSYLYNSRGEAELTASGSDDAVGIDADDCTLTNCIGTGISGGGTPTVYGIDTDNTVNLYSTVGIGATADIVGGGVGDTLNVYGVQYDTLLDTNGTIVYLAGDLTGAPVDAEYVVLTANGTLSDERVLTGTANQITVTDGGAGGNATLSIPSDLEVDDISIVNTEAVWRRYTAYRDVTHSDADWYEIYKDGSTAAQFTIAEDTAWTFRIMIVGTTSGATKTFGYSIDGVLENDGGTTSVLASTVTDIYEADDVSFDARVSADDANDAILIEVQDSDGSSDLVYWTATIEYIETTNFGSVGLLETGDAILLETGDKLVLE